jgi:RHS repeat-associated protein
MNVKKIAFASALGCLLFATPAMASDHVYFFHNDHLGTPQAMSDLAGRKVWEAEYEPFGMATVTTATISNNLRLPGQYYDAETGLHYNYYRDYDSGTGRYLTPDPIGLEGGLNPYSYVGNSPVLYSDPQGLYPNPAEAACVLGPNPVCVGGVAADIAGWVIGGAACAAIMSLPGDAAEQSRSIPTPKTPQCGCTCICRADADDNMVGNIQPGKSLFAFGEATSHNCAQASKDAKRNATQALGMKPKHVGCRCVEK